MVVLRTFSETVICEDRPQGVATGSANHVPAELNTYKAVLLLIIDGTCVT